jgi:serine/threonine-protein kinase
MILHGLDAIHSAKIIHRDIKPANILRNGFDDVVISDFGLATHDDDDGPLGRSFVCGTSEYRPPESLRKCFATPKYDVWAAGMILYNLMSAQMLPWQVFEEGASPRTIYSRIVQDPSWRPSFPSTPLLPPEWSKQEAELKLLLGDILQVDPEKRVSSKEALRRWEAIRAQLPA